MSGAQACEAVFHLINTLAATGSAGGYSGSFSTGNHEVWFLFGYPDNGKRNADASVVNAAVSDSGGSSEVVTIKAAQQFAGLRDQPGVWVLAKIPSLLETHGGLVLDPNLILDGFLRLAYDVSGSSVAITRFHHVTRLQIFDSNGVLIFDDAPVPGTFPIIPIQAPQNLNAYVPTGLHFDGATGLVTAKALSTQNTGKISFAGWFLMGASLTGQLEFSQGSGNNKLFYDTSLPAPAWCHIMGSINSAANQAALFINGTTASGGPATAGGAVGSVNTNGKSLYIGTDTQGNFFTGDIADLSIWVDYSFIENGAISPATVAKFVLVDENNGIVTIQPVNPALSLFGFNTAKQPFQVEDQTNQIVDVKRPDVFLSGPASSALTPHLATGIRIEGVQSLTTVSGGLTNSATNPGKITIVPV